MTRRLHLVVGAAVVALATLSPPPMAAQSTDWSREIPLAAGAGSLVVDLERADVELRPGSNGHIRVRATTLPGRGGPLPSPDQLLDITTGGEGVRISSTDPGLPHAVALVLEVPQNLYIRAHIQRGDMRVRGLEATFDLATTRGDITLEDVAGSAVVDIRNGSVDAAFRSLTDQRPSAFVTLNGNVRLELPADVDTSLDVRCRGCTLEDVPTLPNLEVVQLLAPDGGIPVRALTGSLGGGGATLRVFTWNGEVVLRTRSTP